MFRVSRSSYAANTHFNRLFTQSVLKQTSSIPHQQNNSDDDHQQSLDSTLTSSAPSFLQSPHEWLQHNHGADAIRASSPEYNRWLQVMPPVATMLCLGGIYSWSLYNGPLTHDIGIITQVASDWTLSSVVPVFGTGIFFNGVAGATLGKWIDRSGGRLSYLLGGMMYGGGIMVGGLGVYLHSLPLLYAGYGVIGGLGHGICYISSITTLIQFFPDKRGLAAGMSLMGLGGGAILATPIIDRLLTRNFAAPTQIDDNVLASVPNAVSLNEKGQSFLDLSQIANSHSDLGTSGLAQIAKLDASNLLSSGFSSKVMSTLVDGGTYLVGTGSTGAAATMLVVGGTYMGVILASSLFTKLPHPHFDPVHGHHTADDDSKEATVKRPEAAYSMSVEEAFRTPQFWCLWLAFGALSSTGMGCISTAKTMMSEVFGGSLPLIVTSSFASTYVMAISASNLAGRVGWGYISDKIGQTPTYAVFGMTGVLLYATIPWYVANVVEAPSVAPLALFYASTLFLFSYFGGGFSVMPSYEAKMFGAKNVGAIHGRMMTAVALSGFVGPMIVTQCRQRTYNASIHEIAAHVNPEQFLNEFGAPLNDLDTLIESKVVTIHKLMQLIPEELAMTDPTPFLYDSTMYAMSGCMAICATANLLVRRLGIPKQMREHKQRVTSM